MELYKFTVRFYNLTTRTTERHTLETKTVGQALRSAIALMMGKDARDLVIVQEDTNEF